MARSITIALVGYYCYTLVLPKLTPINTIIKKIKKNRDCRVPLQEIYKTRYQHKLTMINLPRQEVGVGLLIATLRHINIEDNQ